MNIIDCSPIYKSYYALWYCLIVRDSVLEHHWESANGPAKIAQLVLPLSSVKEVLGEVHL
jgi:hypothetical protein